MHAQLTQLRVRALNLGIISSLKEKFTARGHEQTVSAVDPAVRFVDYRPSMNARQRLAHFERKLEDLRAKARERGIDPELVLSCT